MPELRIRLRLPAALTFESGGGWVSDRVPRIGIKWRAEISAGIKCIGSLKGTSLTVAEGIYYREGALEATVDVACETEQGLSDATNRLVPVLRAVRPTLIEVSVERSYDENTEGTAPAVSLVVSGAPPERTHHELGPKKVGQPESSVGAAWRQDDSEGHAGSEDGVSASGDECGAHEAPSPSDIKHLETPLAVLAPVRGDTPSSREASEERQQDADPSPFLLEPPVADGDVQDEREPHYVESVENAFLVAIGTRLICVPGTSEDEVLAAISDGELVSEGPAVVVNRLILPDDGDCINWRNAT